MKHNPPDLLEKYAALLKKWQRSVNLISPNTLEDLWNRHIIDSTQIEKLIPIETDCIIDIGSGAGLPGIPLSISTNLPTYLVESDRKKCLFLEEVARQLALENVKIVNSRIENCKLPDLKCKFPIVTARALASLDKLFELIKTLLENNNLHSYRLILPKGKNADAEIEIAKKSWNFDFDVTPSITDSASNILTIKSFGKI